MKSVEGFIQMSNATLSAPAILRLEAKTLVMVIREVHLSTKVVLQGLSVGDVIAHYRDIPGRTPEFRPIGSG